MLLDEEKEIKSHREYLVVKGNDLIQRSRFELSLSEQKTISFICSMIKPIKKTKSTNTEDISYRLEYTFDIRDYCKVCGIDYDSGQNYSAIKATLKKLSDRSMWLDDGECEILVRWLSKVKINKRSGKAVVIIDQDLAPYLFKLGQKFTQYQLYNVLAMKSAFSVRIYELLKSYEFQKLKVFDLEQLKILLMVDSVKSYKNYSDFKKRVLDKAKEEINELTDLNISFRPIIKGKKVVKIEFTIELKEPLERLISHYDVNDKLDKKSGSE